MPAGLRLLSPFKVGLVSLACEDDFRVDNTMMNLHNLSLGKSSFRGSNSLHNIFIFHFIFFYFIYLLLLFLPLFYMAVNS